MSGNPVTRTTTTDAAGHYTFLVPEGDYVVSYSTPTLLAGFPSLGDATTATSFYAFHAYPGEDGNRTSYDFGVDSSGRLGDTVFADVNGTPGQQTGEAGLEGVTVRPLREPRRRAALNGDETLLQVMLTDGAGKYLSQVSRTETTLRRLRRTRCPPGMCLRRPRSGRYPDNQGTATITGGNAVLTLTSAIPPRRRRTA